MVEYISLSQSKEQAEQSQCPPSSEMINRVARGLRPARASFSRQESSVATAGEGVARRAVAREGVVCSTVAVRCSKVRSLKYAVVAQTALCTKGQQLTKPQTRHTRCSITGDGPALQPCRRFQLAAGQPTVLTKRVLAATGLPALATLGQDMFLILREDRTSAEQRAE